MSYIVSQARHFYPSVSEGDKESGHSGQSFVTAASICVALIKSIFLIIEEEESVWLPRLKATTSSLWSQMLSPLLMIKNIDLISAAQIEAAVTKLWPECPDSFSPSEAEG